MLSFDLLLVALGLIICFVMIQRKKKQLQEKSVLLDPLKSHFGRNEGEDLSIHQYLLKLTGHKNLKYLCGIITLKRNFCLSSIFTTSLSEHLILVGQLKVKAPCVYIFKKRILLKHYGLKYAKKYLLANVPEYKIFGSPEEKHIEFVKKYGISVFFVSYVPVSMERGHDFETQVFLKGSLDLLGEKEFLDEFMGLFDEVRVDSGKRTSEIEQGYRKDLEALKTKEGKSFAEKLVSQVREKNRLKKGKK